MEMVRIECVIIAEIGCNHNGDMEIAKRMIRKAAEAGATFAKFQYYSTEEIKAYERAHPPSAYTPELFKWIAKTEFGMSEFQELAETCKAAKIGFLCTPFLNPKRIMDLNPLVTHWKIRERDSGNEEMREAVLKTGKPVFISCTKIPLDNRLIFHPQISWLYCIPQYPAPISDLNLTKVIHFDGYSNHVPHIIAPLITTIGAYMHQKTKWVLECHVMLDLDEMPTNEPVIDDAVSFTFSKFEFLIEMIQEALKCSVSPYRL